MNEFINSFRVTGECSNYCGLYGYTTFNSVKYFEQIPIKESHGDEPKETCNKLRSEGYHLIKAFQIAEAEDLKKTSEYNGLYDYYLFDTKSSGYGGTGKTFNWNVLQHYSDNTPFLLSGGISLASMDSLSAFDHPQCVGFDLNSRFEISPGLKDPILIKQFINRIVTR